MSLLFSPLTIKDITFRNRIMISPMCQYSSVDGFANDWHFVHLGSRATGGAGLIMQEATAVSPEGRITPDDMGIYLDEHIPKLQTITSFIHQHGAIAGVQLAHAGRKASHQSPWKGGKQIPVNSPGGWRALAPGAIPFTKGDEPPAALTTEGIQKVMDDFRKAAGRALRAGFKVIEIHAAHGYLINEFLSPLSNDRDDEYGGSFENRIRFLLAILEHVRMEWPDTLPLFVRISATDWFDRLVKTQTEAGWNEHDSAALATILKTRGVDLIDCSSGGVIPGIRIPVGPGYQVPLAEFVKKESGILTAAVGMITTAQQAEDILKNNQADLIAIARQSLRDPNFPLHAAKELGDDIAWPDQYTRAK